MEFIVAEGEYFLMNHFGIGAVNLWTKNNSNGANEELKTFYCMPKCQIQTTTKKHLGEH